MGCVFLWARFYGVLCRWGVLVGLQCVHSMAYEWMGGCGGVCYGFIVGMCMLFGLDFDGGLCKYGCGCGYMYVQVWVHL